MRKTTKIYVCKPQRDIKVFELAKCLCFVRNPICHDRSLIDKDCLRHFKIPEK